MPLYEDANGDPFGYDERIVSYPSGLVIDIDNQPFETVGRAVEETMPGQHSIRRWVAVAPVTSNGIRLRPRLIAEEGVRGLKRRAERAKLEAGS